MIRPTWRQCVEAGLILLTGLGIAATVFLLGGCANNASKAFIVSDFKTAYNNQARIAAVACRADLVPLADCEQAAQDSVMVLDLYAKVRADLERNKFDISQLASLVRIMAKMFAGWYGIPLPAARAPTARPVPVPALIP